MVDWGFRKTHWHMPFEDGTIFLVGDDMPRVLLALAKQKGLLAHVSFKRSRLMAPVPGVLDLSRSRPAEQTCPPATNRNEMISRHRDSIALRFSYSQRPKAIPSSFLHFLHGARRSEIGGPTACFHGSPLPARAAADVLPGWGFTAPVTARTARAGRAPGCTQGS